jgi:hypothetical protein
VVTTSIRGPGGRITPQSRAPFCYLAHPALHDLGANGAALRAAPTIDGGVDGAEGGIDCRDPYARGVAGREIDCDRLLMATAAVPAAEVTDEIGSVDELAGEQAASLFLAFVGRSASAPAAQLPR